MMLAFVGVWAISGSGIAAPVFFVEPGTSPVLDVAFQAAVGGSWTEFMLDGFSQSTSIDSLLPGRCGC